MIELYGLAPLQQGSERASISFNQAFVISRMRRLESEAWATFLMIDLSQLVESYRSLIRYSTLCRLK